MTLLSHLARSVSTMLEECAALTAGTRLFISMLLLQDDPWWKVQPRVGCFDPPELLD